MRKNRTIEQQLDQSVACAWAFTEYSVFVPKLDFAAYSTSLLEEQDLKLLKVLYSLKYMLMCTREPLSLDPFQI